MGSAGNDRTVCRHARFGDSLIADLRSIAIAGLGGAAGEATETGGILLGGIIGDELRLEAYEEMPSARRAGPTYTLGPTDRIRLEEMLAARRDVIGFFRSCAGDAARTEADEQFVERYFPRGECVYLTMRAVGPEECVATVRWFRDGSLLPLVQEGPFALELGRAPVLRTQPMLPPPTRAARGESAPRRPRRWIPVLASLLIGLVGGVGYQLWSLERHRPEARPAAKVEWTDLHLDARPSNGQLDIVWSAEAVRALEADGGKLWIHDGQPPREISLTASEVAAGSYRCATTRPDVTVGLIVTARRQTVASDSVRLATSATAVAPPAPREPDAGGAVVPPAAVHQVQPTIPDGIRSRLTAEVVIPVEVRVNERGKVLRARVTEEGGDGVHRYLAEQAERAAREWQFNPAQTRSGTPVAATKTIEFVFTP
jgi:hypothetical protein